jgi:hypothetical protein
MGEDTSRDSAGASTAAPDSHEAGLQRGQKDGDELQGSSQRIQRRELAWEEGRRAGAGTRGAVAKKLRARRQQGRSARRAGEEAGAARGCEGDGGWRR